METMYQLSFLEDSKYTDRMFPDFEILYVLRGSCRIETRQKEKLLEKGDFRIINPGLLYSLKLEQGSGVVSVILQYAALLDLLDTPAVSFIVQASRLPEHRQLLLDRLNSFLLSNLRGESTLRRQGAFLLLIDALDRRFIVQANPADAGTQSMETVLCFLSQHYNEKITLAELCERFYYSVPTFTRLFRLVTGTTFLQYLSELRLYRSLQELLNWDTPVAQLALEHGFSSASAYNKVFKAKYHCSPLQYKKNALAADASDPTIPVDAEQWILELENGSGDQGIVQHVVIDTSIRMPTRSSWHTAVNIGTARQLLNPKLQEMLQSLVPDMHCSIVRMTQITELYHMDSVFPELDQILTFVTKVGLIPMLTFPLSLGAPGSIYASRTVDFFQHLMQHYPDELMKNWYFELISRETGDLQYAGSLEEMIRIYVPNARIGIMIGDCRELHAAMLRQWRAVLRKMDFLSLRAYPVDVLADNTSDREAEAMNAEQLVEQIQNARGLLNRSGLEKTPLYLTEWDLIRFDETILNNSCIKAARLVHVIAQLHDVVDLTAYDCISDLTIASAQNTVLPGARGLFTPQGLPKPAYYAVSYQQYSGRMFLGKGSHYYMTARGKNHYWGMCYYDPPFGSNFYFGKEKLDYPELQDLFDEHESVRIDFELTGVSDGDYCINLCHCNDESSILGILHRVGDLSMIGSDLCNYLRGFMRPQYVTLIRGTASAKILRFSVTLEQNDMVVMDIRPFQLTHRE